MGILLVAHVFNLQRRKKNCLTKRNAKNAPRNALHNQFSPQQKKKKKLVSVNNMNLHNTTKYYYNKNILKIIIQKFLACL